MTGGLGGIGLAVAAWLLDEGAGAVVLNGRRAPDAAAAAALARLRSRGPEVRVEIADMTDEAAVERLVAGIGPAAGLPPLGGVIHSVGVLADAALANQDWPAFERVLWPKVLGAWHLHRATLAVELDRFVLFSSLSGVIGTAGQANHAAANAFLDRLALHRRTLGLPGQAIQWGAWSGLGEAEEARERIGDRLAAAGFEWMTPARGLRAFERLLRADVPSSVVAAVDWSALAAPAPLVSELVEAGRAPAAETEGGDLATRVRESPPAERERRIVDFVREEVRALLRLPDLPPPDVGFFDLGMDSLTSLELRNRVLRALGGQVAAPNTVVLDYPTPARFGRRLLEGLRGLPDLPAPAPPALRRTVRGEDERVAVVGLGCRFPGGDGPEAFWAQLRSGGDAVGRGRPDGLLEAGAGTEPRPWGAYLSGLDRFDADFFRIAPVEAELMDPQQRLLLEVSWEALEDAGLDPERLRGSRTGVHVGISTADFRDRAKLVPADGALGMYLATGASFSAAIGRVAFTLGLEGPAIAVDTACSSSLVAIHQAVAGLARGETDLALAGGVNAILSAELTSVFAEAGMLALDGRCKTFDAAADGYVRGEGCGIVALKRLSDAERDGDRILGVILGSAVNQDGASAGLTVPNGPAQEAVIREALARAGIEPGTVDYLEAHGTGTELGDPIEVGAAAAAYGEGRPADRPLLLGSVKTNVGHLEPAAGVAGLVKVLLSLREGVIPQHLHFETPNPRIEWDALPVRVTAEATGWPETSGRPRRAAVSSFGVSGTNAHLVLEGYGEPGEEAGAPRLVPIGAPASGRHRPPAAGETPLVERDRRVLPLSGRTGPALAALAGRYAGWLEAEDRDGESLADAAWTAGVGRSHFGFRAGVVFGDGAELREQLLALSATGGERSAVPAEPPKVAFLFTGQGSQWAGMGRDLYAREPVFREVVDRCAGVFREERGAELLPVMFGEAAGLERTEWTQPALFALSAGLTELWRSVGVRPEVVLGHSVGEVVAAWASGAVGSGGGVPFCGAAGGADGVAAGGRGDGGGVRAGGCRGGGASEDERAGEGGGVVTRGGERDARGGERAEAFGVVALPAAGEARGADGGPADESRFPQRFAGSGAGCVGGGGGGAWVGCAGGFAGGEPDGPGGGAGGGLGRGVLAASGAGAGAVCGGGGGAGGTRGGSFDRGGSACGAGTAGGARLAGRRSGAGAGDEPGPGDGICGGGVGGV